MLAPSYLKQGDTVLLIATARKTTPELIQPAIDILKEWGLKTETGPHLFKAHHQFSATDKERAESLQWALDHKTAKAILITGGGYGTVRIIDQVNFKNLKKNPKWLIGYSDVTVLHNRLNNLKISSIHATMAFQFLRHREATLSLRDALFGKSIKYEIEAHELNRFGKAEAEIVGGNLSILYSLSGSIDDISTKNKILFLEDLDEYLYHIDRMMIQLKRSGKLKDLKGLIIGGMSDMKDNTVPFGKSAEEIILDAVKEYDYPVCFNFPAGHIENNRALYLGRKAKLSVTKNKISLSYIQ
ncbi:MAG: putative MccF-like protein (microcin resistance) [Bacteroidetes bacterium]|nr:putative MccF-like protein (microcin resistance) [Bacteroidota bacterium]